MRAQSQPGGAGVAPLGFAIGIAVLLVGLIVSPFVIAPPSGAISSGLTIRPTSRTAMPIAKQSGAIPAPLS